MDLSEDPGNRLFQAPTATELIEHWNYDSKSKTIIPLLSTAIEGAYYDETGIILTPAYLYELGIAPEYQDDLVLEEKGEGRL